MVPPRKLRFLSVFIAFQKIGTHERYLVKRVRSVENNNQLTSSNDVGVSLLGDCIAICYPELVEASECPTHISHRTGGKTENTDYLFLIFQKH